MKKVAVLLLLTAGLSIGANAQNPRRMDSREALMKSPEQRAQMKTENMSRRLNLTEAQSQAVYDANLTKAKEMQPMIDEFRASRGKRKAINAQYDARLRETLTTDQYATLEDMKAERKARKAGRMRGQSMMPQNGYQPASQGLPTR